MNGQGISTEPPDLLGIRRRLGRQLWGPPEELTPWSWRYLHAAASTDGATAAGSVIVSTAWWPSSGTWWHASMAWVDRLPTYDELCALHAAVWPDGHAVQQHVPPRRHVNHHPYALHLWGRADGASLLPVELDDLIDQAGMV